MDDAALSAKQVLIDEPESKLACKRTAFNIMHEKCWCDAATVHLQKSNSPYRLPAHTV